MLHLALADAVATVAPAGQQASGGIGQFMPMILIFVIFYFLLIRPQQKKMKMHKAMVSVLKAGDSVITTAGIVGVIKKVEAGTVFLTVSEGVDIEVTKGSVGVVNEVNAEPSTCCSK